MKAGIGSKKLKGVVEVDETYVGAIYASVARLASRGTNETMRVAAVGCDGGARVIQAPVPRE